MSATSTTASTSTPDSNAPGAAKATTNALGIGLGAGLGGGALLALIVGWYSWRRKKTKKAAAAAELSGTPVGGGRKEMPDQEVTEKGSKERYEIQDQEPPTEVAGDMFRAELSATSERTENRF